MPTRIPLIRSAMKPSRLAVALKNPRILACLVIHLDWPALHAILDSSKHTRDLFSDPLLRDLVLSRFIPGYQACRNPVVNLDTLVPITIHHLHLFLISQSFSLHLYPTYALRQLSALYPKNQDIVPLISLTQAHSRFILLLQSLVHSSPKYTMASEPSHSRLFETFHPTLPELTSPAPLSYKTNLLTASLTPAPIPRPNSTPNSQSKPRLSSTHRLSSIFNSYTAPLPAPASQPPALAAYRSSWRRSSRRYSSGVYSLSDTENDLAPPRRRYVPNSSSSKSSLSRSSTPASNHSSSPPPSSSSLARLLTSPHDFSLATARSRAPVLRVFVPCASHIHDQQTIIRCEEQLVKVGLWNHLSTGDIVVNLGHVPFTNEFNVHQNTTDDRRSSLLCPQRTSTFSSNWLIFNGTFLVPFSTTTVQVPDALALPSPFYYTHILPRLANPVFILRHMPQFTLSPQITATHAYANGGCIRPGAEDIQMRLVALPTRVATMHGNGVAVVRRYKWLAQVFVNAPALGDQQELGMGWQGEWILEGDGTKEGKQILLDWLVGRENSAGHQASQLGTEAMEGWEWEWELVRERCKRRRLWLKLLSVRKPEGVEAGIVTLDALGL